MTALDTPATARSRLDRLLASAVTSRIHLGMVLVGRLGIDPQTVLDLTWTQVDLDTGVLTVPGGPVRLSGPMAELFRWHAARQQLDRWRTPRWPDTGLVFVNACGAPISAETADASVAHHCTKTGLPVATLADLRDPAWRTR